MRLPAAVSWEKAAKSRGRNTLPTWGSPVRARSRAPENVNALGQLGRGRFLCRGCRSEEGPSAVTVSTLFSRIQAICWRDGIAVVVGYCLRISISRTASEAGGRAFESRPGHHLHFRIATRSSKPSAAGADAHNRTAPPLPARVTPLKSPSAEACLRSSAPRNGMRIIGRRNFPASIAYPHGDKKLCDTMDVDHVHIQID